MYYCPELGRFLARDMIRRPDRNPYVYASSSPLSIVDPDGAQDVQLDQDKRIGDALGLTFDPKDTAAQRAQKIQADLVAKGYSAEQVKGTWASGTQTVLNHVLFAHFSEQDLLSMVVWMEARGEREALARWVAAAVRNRAQLTKNKVTDVCLSGKAFSGFNRLDPNLTALLDYRKALMTPPDARSDQQKKLLADPSWIRAHQVAADTLAGRIPAGADTVTHYYDTSAADPVWAYTDKGKQNPRTPAHAEPTHGGRNETRFYPGYNVPGMGVTVLLPKKE